MEFRLNRRQLVGGLAAAAALAPLASRAAEVLRFSAIPDEDATKLMGRFTKVAEYLSDKLGVPVEFVPVKSYPAAVVAFRNDQIQLAWFGGLSGVQARLALPGSVAIAQGEEDARFVSYFIANKATGLTEGPDFPMAAKGRSFTFGAKTSTSGRLMPEYEIRRNTGVAPEEFFSRVGFSGDHTKTVELVQSGAYEIGAVNFTAYDDMVAKGQVDPAEVPVIWRTPAYPDYNFTLRGDADEKFGAGFTERLTTAILGMDDPEILGAFPRSRFIAASNADYQPIEEVARQLDLLD
ncbi:putative selenate ABC transporter substrate-binding protein [Paracoccus kondratievae]|uniref:Selenate ABC transporter substrate-binding protein n=1 Tax=Paracoccus kondratievae TaxID=135740 RepID=A0AAD3RRV0_9RHOB|nr:putative selenate ABC transporter substrate-binding protein [Paracoccus kondratievae]QFQ86042.1 putative selenate ABC transporter substrate-binding protein [Paracoccus kondratievae]GLK62998.1 putative selenate ABC transporter substrate-binding protein [Paracoccus kondratievae]